VVLAAGRLVAKKGFGVLVAAAGDILARHPRTVVVVAGDGTLRTALREQADSAGLTANVRFVGAIPWTEMPNALAASDIVAVPSVRDADGNVDGLPTVLLEAMGAGRAVVASDIAGIPLAIEDGVTGVLTRPSDARVLAVACSALLDDGERRHRLGRTAQERARSDLSWRAVARRFLDAFAAAGVRS
jgi:glycosyltransferase involved in cell wall biosynthesis